MGKAFLLFLLSLASLELVAEFLFCLPALLECSSLRQSEQIDIRSVSVKNCSLPFE